MHLFLFVSYKDQKDALSLFVVVVFVAFISGWEKTTRKTDIKVPLDAPSVCPALHSEAEWVALSTKRLPPM